MFYFVMQCQGNIRDNFVSAKQSRTVSSHEIINNLWIVFPWQVVIVPEGCKTIGSRAVADCDELLYVRILSSVNEIAEDAFEE